MKDSDAGCMLDVAVFFFQAEDGIRDLVRSRGLGDVYKRQIQGHPCLPGTPSGISYTVIPLESGNPGDLVLQDLSLIHI